MGHTQCSKWENQQPSAVIHQRECGFECFNDTECFGVGGECSLSIFWSYWILLMHTGWVSSFFLKLVDVIFSTWFEGILLSLAECHREWEIEDTLEISLNISHFIDEEFERKMKFAEPSLMMPSTGMLPLSAAKSHAEHTLCSLQSPDCNVAAVSVSSIPLPWLYFSLHFKHLPEKLNVKDIFPKNN